MTLSKKIRYTHVPTKAYEIRRNTGNVIKVIPIKHVKDFIKRLKRRFDLPSASLIIDEEAGKELI